MLNLTNPHRSLCHIEVKLWASWHKLTLSSSNCHRPILSSSLPLLALSIPRMRVAGVVGGGVVMVIQSQYVAWMKWAASRKRTAHTSRRGNTPPRGPHPSWDAGPALWLEPPSSSASPAPSSLPCSAYRHTPAHCLISCPSLILLCVNVWVCLCVSVFVCVCVCVCLVTCVCIRVISRTKKAEFPSSLWHVTVKSP